MRGRTTLRKRHRSSLKLNPRALAFPISRAPGFSGPCGAEGVPSVAGARVAEGVPMNTALISNRHTAIRGTNSTGVRN